MRPFLLFSGTTEGRRLSYDLAALGVPVVVCVATEYGAEEQGYHPGITVRTGRLDEKEMAALILQIHPLAVLDATHPYAVEVSAHVQKACEETNTSCLRLLRESSQLPEGAVVVDSTTQAADVLAETQGNILLTTGAKELAAFASLGGQRLFPRILPFHQSLDACQQSGIPVANILALQGPFSTELNTALIHSHNIQWLVTKDGGKPGGFTEKAEAARLTGARLVVIRRPAETGQDYHTILQQCKEMIPCT